MSPRKFEDLYYITKDKVKAFLGDEHAIDLFIDMTKFKLAVAADYTFIFCRPTLEELVLEEPEIYDEDIGPRCNPACYCEKYCDQVLPSLRIVELDCDLCSYAPSTIELISKYRIPLDYNMEPNQVHDYVIKFIINQLKHEKVERHLIEAYPTLKHLVDL